MPLPVAAGADDVVAAVSVDVRDRHRVDAGRGRQRGGDLRKLARTHEEEVDRGHPGVRAVDGLPDEHVDAPVVVEVTHGCRLERRLPADTARDGTRAVREVRRELMREAEDAQLIPAEGGHELVGRHAGKRPVEVTDGQRALDRRGTTDERLRVQLIADAQLATEAPDRVLKHEQGRGIAVRAPHEGEEVDRG